MARLAAFRRTLFAGFMVSRLYGGSIEGTVINAVTGEPVIDAHVRFVDTHSFVFTTATDSTGSYHMTGLADGNYRGEFSKDGFTDWIAGSNVDFVLNGIGGARVEGNAPVRVDVKLQPFGTLRGRVVDEEGKPAEGVTVQLSRSVDDAILTNSDGAFVFHEVEPGSYTVVVKPLASPHTRDGERVGFVPVYYPSALELADAVPIRVTWGSDVAGIEIRLKSVPVHRVSGVILDEAGKPVAHAAVRLLGRPGAREYLRSINVGPRNPPLRAPAGLPPELVGAFLLRMIGSGGSIAAPGAEAEAAKMETGDDGAFAFDAVPGGDWRIAALTDEYGWKPRNGVVSAAVADKNLDDLRVRVSPPFVIDVGVDWGTDAAQTAGTHPANAMVALAPLEAQQGMFFDPSGPPPEIFPMLSGRYRVMGAAATGAEYYVSSVTLGGLEVLGQVVDLEPGAGPFRVTMRHDSGSVRGFVAKDGEKGAGAIAFLVSREPGEMLRVLQARCGADGAFTFSGVQPGDYYAVALEHVPGGRTGPGLPARDLPASIVQQAVSVRVNAGSEASVELRVNPWRD